MLAAVGAPLGLRAAESRGFGDGLGVSISEARKHQGSVRQTPSSTNSSYPSPLEPKPVREPMGMFASGS